MSIERDMAFIRIKSYLQTIEKFCSDEAFKEDVPKLLKDLEKLREE